MLIKAKGFSIVCRQPALGSQLFVHVLTDGRIRSICANNNVASVFAVKVIMLRLDDSGRVNNRRQLRCVEALPKSIPERYFKSESTEPIPAISASNSGAAVVLVNGNDLLVVKDLFCGQVLEQAVVECRAVEDDGRVASTNAASV